MVRLKHRYLLVNILYPDSDTPIKSTTRDGLVPNVVSFHRPSSDKLNAQLLARMIRDGVAELFGDYGSGMIASSLVGEFDLSSTQRRRTMKLTVGSEVFISCHFYSHHSGFARTLSTSMGRSELRYPAAATHRSSLCHSGRQSVWNHSQSRRGSHQKSKSCHSSCDSPRKRLRLCPRQDAWKSKCGTQCKSRSLYGHRER